MTFAFAKPLNLALISFAALAGLGAGSPAQAAGETAREKYQNFKQTLQCVDESGNASQIQVIRLDGKMTGKIDVVSLSTKKRETARLQFATATHARADVFANLKTYRYEINFENFAFDGARHNAGEVIKGMIGENDCVAPYYHGQACGWWGPAISCFTKDTEEIKKGLGLIMWPTFDETDARVKPSKKGDYIYIFGAIAGSSAAKAGLGLNARGAANTLVAIEMNGQWISGKEVSTKTIREFIAQQPLGTVVQVKVARMNDLETQELSGEEHTLQLKIELLNAYLD